MAVHSVGWLVVLVLIEDREVGRAALLRERVNLLVAPREVLATERAGGHASAHIGEVAVVHVVEEVPARDEQLLVRRVANVAVRPATFPRHLRVLDGVVGVPHVDGGSHGDVLPESPIAADD